MNCESCEEQAYVIDKLAKLLAEIAIILNGPEPPLTRWSYHDLPEKVRALKAHSAPVAVPEGYALVPVEPTLPMLTAAIDFALGAKLSGGYNWDDYMRDVWAAMLAAAKGKDDE